MAIDLSQFYQIFFEEAAEHLANMETLLVGLDVANPDIEQLNAIFRAAHSIKGSAGTFGFTDMAEVTHNLENLLDRLRKGELALRDEMIDAFLSAGDVLKNQLAAHRGEGSVDAESISAIIARLRSLADGAASALAKSAGETAHAGEPAAADNAEPAHSEMPHRQPAHGLHAQFVLEGDSANRNATFQRLISELEQAGQVSAKTEPSHPDQPYQLDFLGDGNADQLRSMIEFVARSDSVRIEPLDESGGLGALEASTGFFDHAVSAQPYEEAAYGFFEPVECHQAPVKAVSESGDGAYGFFEPVACPSPSVKADSEFGDAAYGFFEPIPAPNQEPKQEPTASPLAEPSPGPVPVAMAKPVSVPGAAPAPVQAVPAGPKPGRAVTTATVSSTQASSATQTTGAKSAGGETTIRVGVEKVDQLINLVGELVITQAMLLQSANGVDPVRFERLHSGLVQLERNSRDLQEAVMSIRMMPISVVFSRFPRVVRELSHKLGKQVELRLEGEDTELDKSLIERLSDPLTHLVRNSLDHGVELPEVRKQRGKPETGIIILRAYHQSGNIVVEVSDDGAGLDRGRILQKAMERGLAAHEQMTDQEVWQLIFEPGFSTAEQVTEVSGRGVGMDVVKRNIKAIGGRVEIDSVAGVGSRMTVRLPLTLAILDGMSVAVGEENYILPLNCVVESLRAEPGMVKSISGVKRLLSVRGEYVPVVALYEVFNVPGAITALERGIMVIVETDGMRAALFVDALVSQQQVVIKSLEANYRKVSGVSGATILGDGHVALILDVAVLADMAKNALSVAA